MKNNEYTESKSIADGFNGQRIIDKYEYEDFDYLRFINIEKYVVGFGIQTFRYCRELTAINVDKENPFFTSDDGVLFDKNMEVLICYPANKIGTQYTVPKTVKRIDNFAFSGARKLYNVFFNECLVEIGDCAFEGCSSLSKIEFPASLEQIGYVAFQGCDEIREFYIPEKALIKNSFPPHLDTISVSEKNENYVVKDDVLYSRNMDTLIKVPQSFQSDIFIVPDAVKKIEENAFSGCTKISKIVINENVKQIGDYAFAWMEQSQKVVLPTQLYELIDKNSVLSKVSYEIQI